MACFTPLIVVPYLSILAAGWIQVYSNEQFQSAFEGKHLLFAGDSVLFQLMARVMRYFEDPCWDAGTEIPYCSHENRVFDSYDRYKIRYSFVWVGGAKECDNRKGLPSLLSEEGRARFINQSSSEADFIIMNAGAHDINGKVPLEDYDRLLPQALDLLLGHVHKVNQRPDRFVYRTTTPLTNQVKVDDNWGDANAGVKWINVLASRHAKQRHLTVLDAARIWSADDYKRRASGNPLACGDGLHGDTCDKISMEAAVLIYHLMNTLIASTPDDDNNNNTTNHTTSMEQQQGPPQSMDTAATQ